MNINLLLNINPIALNVKELVLFMMKKIFIGANVVAETGANK